MNYDQIKNNEIRIFPFYKDKYMGKTEFGFSNRKSAQKFMFDIPENDIFDEFGGKKKYKETHTFLYGLDKSSLFMFNPRNNDRYGRRKYDGCYQYDSKIKVYASELPSEVLDEIKEIGFIFDNRDDEHIEKVRKFQEKWNLFPQINLDMKDYESMHRKFMKDKIDYREGIVHINIEFINKD